MMNSTTDDFGDNPFRSGGGGNEDLFFSNDSPARQPPSMQQQQQHQPQSQQPPLSSDPFAPQPPLSTFPPSGPMQPQQPMIPQSQMVETVPERRSWWGNLMACLSLDSYRAYFDIDTEDITTRIKAVMLHFYKPEYFRNNVLGADKSNELKGPDLYGPFWISTTLVFFIAATTNMHHFLKRDKMKQFDYDINHLLNAGYLIFGFSFGLSSVLWATTRCANMQALQLVEWISLYGYSLVPFFPAVLISIIPLGVISFVFLFVATAISGCLIVRNVAGPMLSTDVGQQKAPPILMVILGTHVVFFLSLKFLFFHVKD